MVGPPQIELHQHGVVGVVQRDDLVALVGKGLAGLAVVRRDGLRPVDHLAAGDELVARMVEGREREVEVVAVLGLGVLAHDGLAPGSEVGVHRHVADPTPSVRQSLRSVLDPTLYSPR